MEFERSEWVVVVKFGIDKVLGLITFGVNLLEWNSKTGTYVHEMSQVSG